MRKKENGEYAWFNGYIKCGWRHRLGNWVSALLYVIENTIIVITFGFVYPNFTWKFMIYKMFDTNFFTDPKEPE